MKIKNLLTTAVSIFIIHHSAFGQGALTPPGAPAATMKTLAQIEPRTAITNTASLVTITQPGSYYLTGNLTVTTGDGIDINTNGVTLDLNGFTIASTAASATGTGIYLNSSLSDITICNGHIRGGVTNNGSGVYSGGGFAYGIYYSPVLPENVLVSRISVSGCLNHGIYLNYGNSTVVDACTVRTVGGYGIFASTVKSSSALDCGAGGIYGDEIADSRGQSSGSSIGLYATATALNCYGTSSSGTGLNASTAQNCYGQSSSYYGLYAVAAENCYGTSSTGTGVEADSAQNCYGSTVSNYGLSTYTAQNCDGISTGTGTGLYATLTASGCYGQTAQGTGMYAFNASFCTANGSFGTAIRATIATGCIAFIGTNIITYKYNMP